MSSIRHITSIPSTNHNEAPATSAPLRRSASHHSSSSGDHSSDPNTERDNLLSNIEENLKAKEADQQAEISTATRVARQPANPDSFATFHMAAETALNSQSLAVGGATVHGTGSISIDRTGAVAHGTLHDSSGQDILGTGGLVVRNAYGEVAFHTSAQDKLAVGILNGAGVHGTGLTATQTLAHSAFSEGFFIVGDAAQGAKVVGNRDSDKNVQVAFKDKKFLGLQLTVGASHGLFGFGVRGYAAQGRDYQLKRWMPPQDAKSATAKQQLWQQKLRSVGLLAQPFERPDLKNPMKTMQVGDEVSFVKQRTLTGGVAAALGGIYVGAHASINKEHQLLVERKDETTMRVTVSPKAAKSTTAGVSLDVPLLAAATASLSRSKGRLFSFEFDLSQEQGHKGYHDILAGIMPSAIIEIGPSMLESPAQTLAALTHPEMFAPGIKLVSLVYGKRDLDIHLSAGLTGLPNLFGDRVGMMGFRRRFGHSQLIAVSPNSLIDRKEAAQESRWGFFRRGQTEVSAKIVQETINIKQQDDIKLKQELYLEASISHLRPGSKTRKNMLQWTNNNFFDNKLLINNDDASLSSKYSYGVKVKRPLNDNDLHTLWRSGKVKNLAPPAYESLDFGNDAPPLTDDQRAEIVGSLKQTVAKRGVGAIRMVNDILGNTSSLKVEVTHDPLKDIEDKLLEKSVKYASPISAETSPKELMHRIATAQRHFESLSTVADDVKNDALNTYFDAKGVAKTVADIEKKQGEVLEYLDLKHLSVVERESLIGALPENKRKAFLDMTPMTPEIAS